MSTSLNNKRRQDGRKYVAILQSNYIPWKGYFDLINMVDEFIIFDEAQYTKNDWRNRNIIKTPTGPLWLTIPIKVSKRYPFPIKEAEADGTHWRKKHWAAIVQNYRKTPYFSMYAPTFEEIYLAEEVIHLSPLNYRFMTVICQILGIQTKFTWTEDYELSDEKTERLVELCRDAGADVYLSGPAALAYVQREKFDEAGIQIEWMDYSGYPEYPQQFTPFLHNVSVLDLIFNTGPDAHRYMKSFPEK